MIVRVTPRKVRNLPKLNRVILSAPHYGEATLATTEIPGEKLKDAHSLISTVPSRDCRALQFVLEAADLVEVEHRQRAEGSTHSGDVHRGTAHEQTIVERCPGA